MADIVIGVAQVRQKMAGMTAYLDLLADATDQVESNIAASIAEFERELQVCIEQKVIKMRPDPVLVLGDDYDIEEPPLDYNVGMIDRWTLPKWTLRRRPVISIEAMRLEFDRENRVLTIPDQWIRCNKNLGVLSILPIGTAAVSEQTGLWFLPLLEGQWLWRVIPQFVAVDYTAGYADPDTDPSLAELRNALASDAAARTLEDITGMIPAGVSLDNFNQNFEAVASRIERMRKGVEQFKASWTRTQRPLKAFVI